MLRGIIASVIGFALLSWLTWLAYYTQDKTSFPFNVAQNLSSTIVLILLVALSFIAGLVTRAVSRGSFGWTFLALFASGIFYFSKGLGGTGDLSEGAFVGYLVLFAVMFVLLSLIGFLGWKVMKRKQNKTPAFR